MEKLIQILADLRPDLDFTVQERLVDDAILDSFDIIALVSEINDVFGVDIGVTHLAPENFNSASAMLALIERLKMEK